MRQFLKSSFLCQFAGGFALGALGLFAFGPAEAAPQPAPTHIAR